MNSVNLKTTLAILFSIATSSCAQTEAARIASESGGLIKILPDTVKNVQIYKNVRITTTNCAGERKVAWVLISPRAFPESLSGKFALLKFRVDGVSKPYDVNLVEGDAEIAHWSTRALLRSKFPA